MSALTRIGPLLACAALLLGVGACARSEVDRALELSVVDDRGEALAEVGLGVGARVLARTDSRGRARLARRGLPAAVALTAHCPEAYRPAPTRSIRADQPIPRVLQFVCRPRLRTLAVVTYAPGSQGALLRADAQVLGRVGADGTLHTVLRRPPGAAFTLSLESQPRLAQPVRVGDRDEIIVLDATR